MDDTDIGLRHLRVLSLLLEIGNLTRAAEIMGLSQPSISKMLGRLRIHFGDPLLVRVGGAMAPTPKALALVEPLRGLLAASDALRASSRAFDPATSRREFTVLVTEVGMIQLVAPLMRRLQDAGPHLRLRALPLDSRPFEIRLEAGEADIALGAFPKATGTLLRQHLYSSGFSSVVRKGHPRAADLCQPSAFWGERHVVVTASNTGHDAHRAMERLLVAGLDPDLVQVRVPSFLTAAVLASRSDAVATLPTHLAHFVAEDFGLTVFAPPLPASPIEIDHFWHARMQHDAGHGWLRANVYDLFAHDGRASRQ